MTGCRIKRISSWCMVAAGTFLMAAGTNMVYEPMSMVTGGFAGIGIICRHYFGVPLWGVTIALNIPLFFVAIKIMGKKFALQTVYGIICFSAALAVIPHIRICNEDFLMAAVSGGTLNGAGLALVFRQGASTGGSDLLAAILKTFFPGVSTASVLAVIDGVIVLAGMLVFGVRIGLYSIVAVFITSKLTDSILDGLKFAKMLYIISSEPEMIARNIMRQMNRGVTALRGEGMYSGKNKKVLLCASSRRETVEIIRIVKQADAHAFVIVSDVREVLGEGFGT